MQYVAPDHESTGASQSDSGASSPHSRPISQGMPPVADAEPTPASRGSLQTVMSPSIEDDFARLFSFAEKSTGGGYASLHGRGLPASFWKMPGHQVPGLLAGTATPMVAVQPLAKPAVMKASKKKNTKKGSLASPISTTGKVFLPITDRTPRKDGRESPTMSPSPASKVKGKKRPKKIIIKNRRKLNVNTAVGGGGGSGRASAPPPMTLSGYRSPVFDDDVDDELPSAEIEDMADVAVRRAPGRSHSMPDLGTLGVVWEFPENHFGGYDAMPEDGDSIAPPSHHGSITSSGGLDTDTLSPGSGQDINMRSPGEYIKWDSELKLFSEGMSEPDHEDTEMAMYDDKVNMDYSDRSAFRPAGIGVSGIRGGHSVSLSSTDVLLGGQNDIPFVTE